ncbi:MAG: hypothetical protein GY866_07135, partial [Proteobacteria bacterium]|nr:hypothetical protein [Pseudomonadota bacterium]
LGFLVLRAKLTLIGVWSGLPIADDRYLSEGGLFLVDAIESFLFPWAFIGFVIVGLGFSTYHLWHWLKYCHKKNVSRETFSEVAAASLSKYRNLWLIGYFIGAVVLAKSAATIFLVDRRLLGQLVSISNLDSIPHSGSSDQIGQMLALFVATCLCVRVFFGIENWTPKGPLFLRAFGVILIVFETLSLPINYGLLKSDQLYPVATLESQKENIPSDEQVFILWDGKERLIFLRSSEIVSVSRADINSITVRCYASVFEQQHEEDKCAKKDNRIPKDKSDTVADKPWSDNRGDPSLRDTSDAAASSTSGQLDGGIGG